MDKFEKCSNMVIFKYPHERYSKEEIRKDIMEKGYARLFGFTINNNSILEQEDDNDDYTSIIIGNIEDNFVKLSKTVFAINHDFYIDSDFFLTKVKRKQLMIPTSSFYKYNVILKISEMYDCDVFVVSDDNDHIGENGYIPCSAFLELINKFPNSHEVNLYQNARIDNVIGDFFNNSNALEKYEKYLNTKIKNKDTIIQDYEHGTREYDLIRYKYLKQLIEEKLEKDELSENEWQINLYPIIPILFPKYVGCLQKVPVIRNDKPKENKQIDMLLYDIEGNVCIFELKKPFNNKNIIHKYRNNFCASGEINGAVTQIEKYIYHFNCFKKQNTDNINKKYSNELNGIEIKLINPQGLLIYGRSNNLTPQQKEDFEIVKKQYKNVIDIITYDDLLQRLTNTIELFEKGNQKTIEINK